MNTSTDSIRMNVTLPVDLVREVKKITPTRGVSAFLAIAVRDRLRAIKRKKALGDILKAPATFNAVKNASAYVTDLRKLDAKRTKRLEV